MRRFVLDRLKLRRAVVAGLAAWSGACTGDYGAKPTKIDSSVESVGRVSSVGLISAAAGDGSVRLEWTALDGSGAPLAVAVYQSSDPSSVYGAAAVSIDPLGAQLTLAGLSNGEYYYFGIAAETSPGVFTPAGQILRARPNPPIYVDIAADPALADGKSAATAFPEPLQGLLAAQAAGGGNLWIAGGDYADQSLPLVTRVEVYGGFAPGMVLDERDRVAYPTRLHGRKYSNVIDGVGDFPGAVLDGLEILGDGLADCGFRSTDLPFEMRAVEVSHCLKQGIAIDASQEDFPVDARFAFSSSRANGREGLLASGPYNLTLDGCDFSANDREGLKFADQIAPDSFPIFTSVRGSRFFANGRDGFELQLDAPQFQGPSGSTFFVSLRDSSFEKNVGCGLIVDIDTDLIPGWTTDITLERVLSRANTLDGVEFDLDSTCRVFLSRLLSSANGRDGMVVTSESTPSFVSVSASAFVANQGYGVQAAVGQVPVYASHSIFAGNALGGLRSLVVESGVVSSIAWLQPAAFTNAREHFDAVASDPFNPVFTHAPREYLSAIGFVAPRITLEDLGNLAPQETLELEDDGRARSLASFAGGTNIVAAPASAAFRVPGSVVAFSGTSVVEDYHVLGGSLASGAAMVAPGAARLDCGPAGPMPGVFDEFASTSVFRASDASANLAAALATGDALDIGFAGGTLDPASVHSNSVRVLDSNGIEQGILLSVVNGRLHIDPPLAGWPSGAALVLELHAELASLEGAASSVPLAIPLRVQ